MSFKLDVRVVFFLVSVLVESELAAASSDVDTAADEVEMLALAGVPLFRLDSFDFCLSTFSDLPLLALLLLIVVVVLLLGVVLLLILDENMLNAGMRRISESV